MAEYSMNSNDFFIALGDGQLIGSRCKSCGTFSIPQRQICSNCHATQSEIITFSGEGVLAAYTVISVPSLMMAEAGYSAKNPYCVGIVQLKEGPRISGQILEVNVEAPETIEIGTPLKMMTITRGEDENKLTYLAFKPI